MAKGDGTGEVNAREKAVNRIAKLFEDQGYVIGRPGQVDDAINEMDHFISEFKFLRWKKMDLSPRELACLHALHSDLYDN